MVKALLQMSKKTENWSDVGDLERQLQRQKFLIGLCYANLCTERGSPGWVLGKDDPCAPKSYRQGINCGQCKEGYSRTPGVPAQVSEMTSVEKL